MLRRLNLLGGLTLLVDGDPVGRRLSQPRRLALLALVGLEGETGVTRQRVASFLWPDSDEDRARHALAQLLYIVRHDLDAEDLFVGQDVLRLNPALMSVDVVEMQDAVRRGDDARAVELYRGPVLDGIHLSGSIEFDHWADSHRQRVAAQFEAAADRIVAGARARGDFSAAASTARRRLQLSPFDSRGAAQLVDALVDAGDCAAAMKFAEQHDSLVRDELGHPPDRIFADSVRRLRAQQHVVLAPDAQEVTQPPSRAEPQPAGKHGTGARTRWIAAGLALAAIIATGFSLAGRSAARADTSPDVVAVLPFDVRAPQDLAFLGKGLADLLSASLEATNVLRSVDPHFVARATDTVAAAADRGATTARRVAAPLFVTGALVESDSRVRLTAALYRAESPSTPVARASADGTRGDLFALVDRVALALVAGRLGGMAARFEGLADKSASSLAAIRDYVEGEAAFRGARYRDAIDAFQRATQEDSTFALAYYRLAIAYDWAGYSVEARSGAAAAAVRHGVHLPQHERDLVEAINASMRGYFQRAYEICRRVVAEYPHDVAAWNQLGEIQFHYNPWLGRPFNEARPAFERVAALAPEDPGAPLHLARIAAHEGRDRDVDSLMRTYTALNRSPPDPEASLFDAVATRNTRAQDSILARMRVMGADTLAGASWRLAQYTLSPSASERVVRQILDPARSMQDRIAGFQLLSYIFVIEDRWRDVQAVTDSIRRWDPTRAEFVRAQAAIVPSLAVRAEDIDAARRDLEQSRGNGVKEQAVSVFGGIDEEWKRDLLIGELSARLHDVAALNAALRTLSATKVPEVTRPRLEAAIASLRSDSLELAGHSDGAYVLLRAAADSALRRDFWLEAPVRDHLARLALALGRREEASRWYATFAGGFWSDLLYQTGAERALAALARSRGDTADAAEHVRRLARVTSRP